MLLKKVWLFVFKCLWINELQKFVENITKLVYFLGGNLGGLLAINNLAYDKLVSYAKNFDNPELSLPWL